MDLFEELISVIKILRKFRYLLVGGMAYTIYDKPRFTEDIDFMITETDFPNVKKSLTKAGFLDIENIMQLGRTKIARCIKIKSDDTLIIDFLLKPAKEFAKYYSKKNTISRGNIKIDVISLEGLVKLKLQRNSPQDKVDIKNLKKVRGYE